MKKTIYVLVMAVLCLNFKAMAHQFPEISGRVTGASGKSLPDATVKIKSETYLATTDKNGNFNINTTKSTGTLIISFLGYQTKEVAFDINKTKYVQVILQESENALTEVSIVSTGYQNIPKERATGSFTQPNKEAFESRITTDVISRLQGITSGLDFNPGITGPNQGKPDISIRGRSTIYSNDQPLIVVDNFPYNGNINDINPQDVESINILKDAAAASIWGVKAGNGVIVITTKKGKKDQATRVSAGANVTIGEKSDLYYDRNFLSADEYINVQQFLFRNGKYDADLVDQRNYPSIPAAVEIMAARRNGTISDQDSINQIGRLKSIDIRDGLYRYYYVHPINQQYSLNISSSTKNNHYYFSSGYDKIQTELKSVYSDRITLNFNNTYTPIAKLEITTQFNYVLGSSHTANPLSLANATGISNLYFPYTSFADENGNPLPLNRGFNNAFIKQALQNNFLDWSYVPLQDLKEGQNITKTNEARIFTGLKYQLFKGLSLEAKYQYQQYKTTQSDLRGGDLYSTRDLINKYSILSNGKVTSYNIPLGDMLFLVNGNVISNNLRGQINYSRAGKHSIYAIAGAEIIEYRNSNNSNQLYGYNPETDNFTAVNNITGFNLNPSGFGYIDSGDGIRSGIDRFKSFFTSASYTYNNKYTLSASARQDGSNYFGVSSNQKKVPLWSAGLKWDITAEKFFSPGLLSSLQLRATYGYNGNLNKSVTGITTFRYNTNAAHTNLPYATISNLGNPELRWEKNAILNLGIDFNTSGNRLSGSVEYFFKNGSDLIGDQLLSPSVGYLSPTTATNALRGNFAHMKGSGFDLQLNSKNIKGNLTWTTMLNFSRATDEVTRYDQKTVTSYGNFPTSNGSILPHVGKPVYSLYSYKWAGLDPNTGDPQGFVNGNVSKNYSELLNPASINEIVYEGPSRPVYFGGISNNFTYQRFSLLFNINFKLGYYFRRSTINYNELISGGPSHNDYTSRWQKTGDERKTSVPSLIYPASSQRDNFYAYSEATIEKGDHIRLQDISLSYDIINPNKPFSSPIRKLQIFIYANNLGILWRANKKQLDPDFAYGGIPYTRTIALGLKTDL
ncbi:SusC/RagA family TonB-linked outer membrane protein [Pedobacter antarcticus]|uniref:SusC/RagA family TonB-linked outer membrane protein n=1 Tax=Pedobacter antarcticus TaxID=34086 RepID=UPI002931BBCF|nr:SusC/RagA family TonB-linked outer membrane protein [Pedobacter antarcticus]